MRKRKDVYLIWTADNFIYLHLGWPKEFQTNENFILNPVDEIQENFNNGCICLGELIEPEILLQFRKKLGENTVIFNLKELLIRARISTPNREERLDYIFRKEVLEDVNIYGCDAIKFSIYKKTHIIRLMTTDKNYELSEKLLNIWISYPIDTKLRRILDKVLKFDYDYFTLYDLLKNIYDKDLDNFIYESEEKEENSNQPKQDTKISWSVNN